MGILQIKGNYEAHDRQYYESCQIGFERELTHLANRFEYLFPDGFRAAVEFESNGDIYYRSHLYSGDIPDVLSAKMNTVRQYPNRGISGAGNIIALCNLLIEANLMDNCPHAAEMDRLIIDCPLAHPNSVCSDSFKDWLHQTAHLSYWQGALTVPFQNRIINNSENHTVEGYIRVGFSGAKEYEDLDMAVRLFAGIQEYLDRFENNTIHSYNLDILQANPHVKYLLSESNVRPADSHFPFN